MLDGRVCAAILAPKFDNIFGQKRRFSAFGLQFGPPNLKPEYGRKSNFRTVKFENIYIFRSCAHHCYKSRQLVKYSSYSMGVPLLASKEVCNGGVACSLLKLDGG